MLIDLLKTPMENFIDLVIDSNPGKTLTESQFTTVGPVAVAEPVGTENTSIELKAVLGEGYSNAVTFTYTRQALTAFVAEPITEKVCDGDCEEATVLAELIEALGLMASEIEIDGALVLPTVDDETGINTTDGSVTIKAKADSLLYVGSHTVALKAKVDPRLDVEFAVTGLDGFDAPIF